MTFHWYRSRSTRVIYPSLALADPPACSVTSGTRPLVRGRRKRAGSYCISHPVFTVCFAFISRSRVGSFLSARWTVIRARNFLDTFPQAHLPTSLASFLPPRRLCRFGNKKRAAPSPPSDSGAALCKPEIHPFLVRAQSSVYIRQSSPPPKSAFR